MNKGVASTIVFAGGGSGGHLFPAIAVAQRVVEQAPDASVVFLCSDRRIDASILSKAPWPFVPLPAQPAALRPFPWAPLRFVTGWHRTRRVVREEFARRQLSPGRCAVVTMGGYVAAPVAIEARAHGIATVLCNLDVVAGKANRFIARKVDRVVTAVPCPDLDVQDPEIVGMPIRKAAINTRSTGDCRRDLLLDPDLHTLLITGASQGATTLNRLMIDLVESAPEAFDGWQIIHLAGDRDELTELKETYDAHKIPSCVVPFLDDMATAWGAASLALSRCDASSVAEAIANAVPTIFCPYPWHRDKHQALNARRSVDDGVAWLVDDAIDPEENLATLGPELLSRMHDHERRMAMAASLRDRRTGDPAQTIARLVLHEAAADRSPNRP